MIIQLETEKCIAATIEVEILFACSEAKRLERIACMPPKLQS